LPTIDPNNKYTAMQRRWYDAGADEMAKENHRSHDANPDYWDILLGPVKAAPAEWAGKLALDFGCGIGRNVDNLARLAQWRQVHGVDISAENVKRARAELLKTQPPSAFELFVNSGADVDVLGDHRYDFVMSTIVFQHIAVWSVRHALLIGLFQHMNAGGVFSLQVARMGRVPYRHDGWDVQVTNGACDFGVDSVDDMRQELVEIGFEKVEVVIRPEWNYVEKKYSTDSEWLFWRMQK
jgi:cyclopropane fatty-acyl-phospholipid synthase-like methyltransferase